MPSATPRDQVLAKSSPVEIGPHPNQRGLYQIESRLWLPRPIDEVFAFFSDAANLESLTPPWLRFEIVTPQPISMQTGQLIDYRLTLRGLPLKWRSEILDWDPPRQFVDEMRRGPYRHWHHRHVFEPRDGGTDIIDVVDYAVPGGAFINWLLVQRDLHTIFEFRRQTLIELLAR
ncbi:MAG: SRPBCC family protein [Planctomycetaceae bacterium]